MSYSPEVDDYVKWKDHEGWVYFKCEHSISIELSVKDKVFHEHGRQNNTRRITSYLCVIVSNVMN